MGQEPDSEFTSDKCKSIKIVRWGTGPFKIACGTKFENEEYLESEIGRLKKAVEKARETGWLNLSIPIWPDNIEGLIEMLEEARDSDGDSNSKRKNSSGGKAGGKSWASKERDKRKGKDYDDSDL